MFNILNLYWDVIPAEVIAVQCKNLYTNLTFDVSISVRLAVFKVSWCPENSACCNTLRKGEMLRIKVVLVVTTFVFVYVVSFLFKYFA